MWKHRTIAMMACGGVGVCGTVLAEPTRDETRGLVAEMLADAESRSSLLADSATSGYDKGFFVASSDGAFKLVLNGMLQFRYVLNERDDPTPPGDDLAHGFQASRTRLSFGGHVGDPSMKFYILTAYTATGSTALLDAYFKKEFSPNWSLTLGQFKLPLMYEWMVTERTQQFVERSLVENRFSQVYSQGVMVTGTFDAVRVYGAFSDGLRSSNTDLVNGAGEMNNADWAATGRLEWKAFGDWSQDTDFESFGSDKPMFVLAGAIHGQDGLDVTSNSDRSIVRWTFDMNWKLGGASIFAAVVGSHEETTARTLDMYGAMVQGGVFITDDLELIARYEWADIDDSGTLGEDLSVITFGFNRFFAKHALKLTVDAGYGFNPIDSPFASTGRGVLSDGPDKDGQAFIRAQFQVLF